MIMLKLPVVITDIKPLNITFRAQTALMECPKCARGEGCGAYPWFQGFLFKKSLEYSLPMQQVISPGTLEINCPATLQIERSTMNILSIMTYGLALFGFFLGLSLSVLGVSEALQMLAAITGLILGVLLNKLLSKRYLARHLRLEKANTEPVKICQVTTN